MGNRILRYGIKSDGQWYIEEFGEEIAGFLTKEDLKEYANKHNLLQYLQGPWEPFKHEMESK